MSVCRTGCGRRARLGALTGLFGAVVLSCTLTTSLDGLQGPPLTASDSGPDTEPSAVDGGVDGGADVVETDVVQTDAGLAYPSCATLPPGSRDGFYLIDPTAPALSSRSAPIAT